MQTMLLTGCASGIGRHLTGALARRGHRVAATDVDEASLDRAAAEDRWPKEHVSCQHLDVRDEAGWEDAFDRAARAHGQVDVLMNVAGVLKPAWVHELSAADVDLHLEVNVKGTVLGTRAAARRMRERRSGHVINFGSLASLAPVPGLSLYTASKFAVRGFSLAAATELARHGVAVTVVMPDAVQTPMLDLQADYEEAALTFSGDRPLTVEDIERVVLDVLVRRPMEVAYPAKRGALARLANALPDASRLLAPVLAKKGRRAQAKRTVAREG
jgi:3-oxoacyl-[acyl-carrier protein] reductase